MTKRAPLTLMGRAENLNPRTLGGDQSHISRERAFYRDGVQWTEGIAGWATPLAGGIILGACCAAAVWAYLALT